jgi:hypothetical protein
MKGLKAMFKKLSPSQKKEMMSAKYGMEKPLMKMGGEGMLDMSKQMEANMRYGGRVPMTQKQLGGEDMGPIPGNVPERLRPSLQGPDDFGAPTKKGTRRANKMFRKIKRKARKNARQKARQQRKTGKGDSPFNSNNLSRMQKGGQTKSVRPKITGAVAKGSSMAPGNRLAGIKAADPKRRKKPGMTGGKKRYGGGTASTYSGKSRKKR